MRIWLDPDMVAAYNLRADEVLAALRAQNLQVSAGILNQPPVPGDEAYQINIEALGRLSTPEQFGDIIVKSDSQGRVTRIRDIGRVEVGAADYGTTAYMDRSNATTLLIYAQPGANSLAVEHEVLSTVEQLKKDFPPGVDATIIYDPNIFISKSIKEVVVTIFVAILLVVGVVFVFLQNWRATIIPCIAIPVSLIGTFTVLAIFGISLNNLSLFGLVLAVGIVVDDAIVVVENVERNMRSGMSPLEAAHRTMDEVGGALISIALTLCAVFVPAAFLSGISGLFFRQFAVTIAASTVISCFVSLTLSPALCAVLFKAHSSHDVPQAGLARRLLSGAFDRFNRGFDRLSFGYGNVTRRLVRAVTIVLVVYAGLIGIAGVEFAKTPTGFIPEQDQGYLINIVQLPPGATLDRTEKVIRRGIDIILGTKGVEHVAPFAGLDATTNTVASNSGTIFSGLPSLYNHELPGVTANTVLADLRQRLSIIKDAHVVTIPPPPVQGLGSAGGFKLMLEDRGGLGSQALVRAANALVDAANKDPDFAGVFTLFNAGSPSIYADIDRLKAEKVGLTPTDVFSTLQVYLGSQYVNDFNYLGRTYEVIVQANGQFRRTPSDITRLKVRNASGEMVPIGTVAQLRDRTVPYRVPRYNLFPAAEVQGVAAPGVATGTALHRMEELARQVLPRGIAFEWTDLAYQQQQRGTPTILVFGAAALFVFLVLVGAVRKLEAAAGDRPDRANVPARLSHRPAGAGHADRYPGTDRLCCSRRLGRQERYSDRRVRTPEARGRCRLRRSRRARRPYPSTSDPDDLILVHPRRCSAGSGDRSRSRDAAITGHGRALWHAGRDRLWSAFHAGLLHLHPRRWAQSAAMTNLSRHAFAHSLARGAAPACTLAGGRQRRRAKIFARCARPRAFPRADV